MTQYRPIHSHTLLAECHRLPVLQKHKIIIYVLDTYSASDDGDDEELKSGNQELRILAIAASLLERIGRLTSDAYNAIRACQGRYARKSKPLFARPQYGKTHFDVIKKTGRSIPLQHAYYKRRR